MWTPEDEKQLQELLAKKKASVLVRRKPFDALAKMKKGIQHHNTIQDKIMHVLAYNPFRKEAIVSLIQSSDSSNGNKSTDRDLILYTLINMEEEGFISPNPDNKLYKINEEE